MWASGQRARLYSHDLSLNPPTATILLKVKEGLNI